jgi:hypothetical protein
LEAIADDLRRPADLGSPSTAEAAKLAELVAAAQREQDRTRARFEALEVPRFEATQAATLTPEASRPARPSRLARRWQARFAAAEQAAVRAEQAAAESERAALASEPTAGLVRRLSSFTWNLRLTLAVALTIRRMRKEGRRRQAVGRDFQRQIRAAREAVKKLRRARGGGTRAPREAIAAAAQLLEQARGEQRELVRHCAQARDEIARWEAVARHELTQGREKTARRALARRNQWARSFRHQVLEAEKQQAALAAHDGLLQAVTEELERQTASV